MKTDQEFLLKGTKYGPLMHLLVPALITFSMLGVYLAGMDAVVVNLWPEWISLQFQSQPDRILLDTLGTTFISFMFSLALANYINGKANRPTITWPWAIPVLIAGFYALFVIFVLYEQGGQYSSRSFWNHLGIICVILASFLTIMVTKHVGIVYLLAMLIIAIFIVGLLPAVLIMLPLALVQTSFILIKWIGQRNKRKFNINRNY